MIVFDLRCTAGHVFEAWFRNSDTFEEQREAAAIACPDCGATEVVKAPMAPRIATGKGSEVRDRTLPREDAAAGQSTAHATPVPEMLKARFREVLAEVRAHVEANFDNVGKAFPEEARKIHYGEAEARPIYGEATADESRALHEEGIDFVALPVLPKSDA